MQSRFSIERAVGASGGFGGVVPPGGQSGGSSPRGMAATIVIKIDLVRVVGW
jgi:hypothetical protein